MTAAQALGAAHAAGIRIATDGRDLLLEAGKPPPIQVLTELAAHKNELISLLQARDDGWSADDWQAFFDERAGIAEFDGGLSRERAEARAFACCVAEWLNRHPMLSPPVYCAGCGRGDDAHDPLVPHGADAIGHAWLHSRCWPAWRAQRREKAQQTLSSLGIRSPNPTRNNHPSFER